MEKQEIDELIPERSALPTVVKKLAAGDNQREWAHIIDVNRLFPEFYEKVPELAHHVCYLSLSKFNVPIQREKNIPVPF
jgi:hypothetical protein